MTMLGVALLMSSCGTYTAEGAYVGAQFGTILGSAVGGISGGWRGSDIGAIVGMAGGAVVGAAGPIMTSYFANASSNAFLISAFVRSAFR